MLSHSYVQLFLGEGCCLLEFGSSVIEMFHLMEPKLPVCKLQNCQNHLGARKKHLCTKSPYRKPSDDLFYEIQGKYSWKKDYEFRIFLCPKGARSCFDPFKES